MGKHGRQVWRSNPPYPKDTATKPTIPKTPREVTAESSLERTQLAEVMDIIPPFPRQVLTVLDWTSAAGGAILQDDVHGYNKELLTRYTWIQWWLNESIRRLRTKAQAKGQDAELVAFKQFGLYWKWCRMFMPLQSRLMVEQCLYDRGYPWRALFTGFAPITKT